MENAADALKMAAAILIFVLALSISINAFSEARQASDIILKYNDREYEDTYIEETQIKDSSGTLITERTVGIESIIPSIYKAYKENYKIVFNNPNNISNRNIVLYKKRVKENVISNEWEEKNYIDLENESIAGGEEQKRIFINAILYGKNYKYQETDNTGNLRTKTWENIKDEFKFLGIDFINEEGIYSSIENNIYKESLGVYYQEEVDGDNSNMPNANKTKKRVITYSAI